MNETVWVYRETVTLVRIARRDGGGPEGAVPAAGARLGWVGTGLVLAALGVVGVRLAARRSAAVPLVAPSKPPALAPGMPAPVGASGRAA